MREIQLTQGLVARVDEADYEDLAQFKWYAARYGKLIYATRKAYVDGKRINFCMHRQILGDREGFEIDHIDGDGLHNSRKNLRHATVAQNGANRRIDVRNKTGVTGVRWFARSKAWRAQIQRRHLGTFQTFEAAVAARKQAEENIFGEFAHKIAA